MPHVTPFRTVAQALLAWLCAVATVAASDVDYQRDVKPLLQARCYTCHGALQQRAGMRLDTVELMLRGGDSGPVVVKGNAAKSLLLTRVSTADIAERMPPEHEGEGLTNEQIELLRAWIAAGAVSPAMDQPEADPRDHWSFRPVERPAIPQVTRAAWAQNPIDLFIARHHERLGLNPRESASRSLLLRRLSLDLIGLPPTAEEIAKIESDSSTDWYDRQVNRLLEDPRHGERWARHWMDVWRYSDWWGLGDQLRNSHKHIWHWRDWIVESLNADIPYDEMVRLMLAADELHPNDLDKLRATGYLARNYFLFNRNHWMDETVEHVAKGFLGLTINCAKCHDHKFDPISQKDYYRMRAFFEPYHVRLDMRPGEVDLDRDAIPRAFDGLLDLSTYRFIRGDENHPDKVPIPPGIPKVLEFEPLKIDPVELPAQAWQPERRPWVVEAHRQAARKRVEAAEAKLSAARDKLATVEKSDGPANAVEELRLESRVAEMGLEVARAEVQHVERSAAAMQATWNRSDQAGGELQMALAETEKQEARAAARAERELAAARARLTLADTELRLHRAAADKRDAITKEVAAARESVDKSVKQVDEPSEKYTVLQGAQWLSTRFFNSTKDDPTVTFPPRSSGRRTALANWITDRRNPLTARVAVNHLWMRHFGVPLVPTVFNFGRKGTPPANLELLDWLAAELIDSGWSMKHMHRLMVQSATYRLSTATAGDEANLAKDRENLYLWSHSPVRLESQAIRDSILSLAGTIDFARGGPPVPPANQAESTRRSVYLFHSNNERNPFLTMFDEAAVKECYRRDQSIVPQQALALTNSRLVLDASPQIADRISREAVAQGAPPEDDAAFIRLAFVLVLGASPNPAELAAALESVDAWKKLPEAASAGEARALSRTNLIWVLLNHNDFVTLR